MKFIQLLGFCFFTSLIFSQGNTEIHLFDIKTENNKLILDNYKNISNNNGYDNQPAFYDDRYILFSSTRNEQTDIAKYDTRYGSKLWLNFTEGGEYTPLKIPNAINVSAVRLDKDGKQRLYKYNWSNGESTELINDLVVAYYTWYDENTVLSAVIEEESLNLYTTNIQERKSRKYATKVGRSFHNIPNSNLVSFISKENENQWQIKSLDPTTGVTKLIANTIEGVEDICWLDSKTILSSKDSVLYKLTLKRDNNWKQLTDLSSYGITKISRLAVNSSSTKLLVAGDIGAGRQEENKDDETESNDTETTNSENTEEKSEIEAIVQRNLDAYNARDIDGFMKDYADSIKLYNYPNELRTEGKEAMRKSYKDWFDRVSRPKSFY